MGRLMSAGWIETMPGSVRVLLGSKIKNPVLLRALERERVRADRSGLDLALVFFKFKRMMPLSSEAKRLVATLQKRARITDEVGLYGRRGAFALLPDTDEDGAKLFAASVCDLMQISREQLGFEVLMYHPQKPRRDDDPRGGNGLTHGRNGTERIVVVRDVNVSVPASAVEADRGSWDADALIESGINGRHRIGFSTMHHLFERPTPLWKRLIDITAASLGLLMLSPVLLAIAVLIKVDSSGPVIFRQRRAGQGGRPFTMFKFRTMVTDAEALKNELIEQNEIDGPAFKIKDDPRVTRIGSLLRRTSLDELPQLCNVLMGDMTLVGPRPLPCDESESCEHWHRARLHVTPGLTCTWQISGRSEIAFDEWMRMDLDYVRNRGLWTDLRILAGTFPAVVTRRGAY